MFVCVLSRVQLFSSPKDWSLPGSSVHGYPRPEYWSGLPFPTPGNLPDSGIKPTSSAFLAFAALYHLATWEALSYNRKVWSPDQSITRDFLAKQILKLHPRPTESECLGACPSTSCFGKSSNWISYMAWSSLKTCLCHSLLLLLINKFFFFFCWSISPRKFFTSDKWVVNFYALPVSKTSLF